MYRSSQSNCFGRAMALAASLVFALSFALMSPEIARAVDEPELVVEAESTSIIVDDGRSESNDELFSEYVDRAFEDRALPLAQRVTLAVSSAAEGSARSQLEGYDRALFDVLSTRVRAIAAGEEHSTVFTPDLGQFIDEGVLKERYYASDLGLNSLLTSDGGSISSEASSAFREVALGDSHVLIRALLQDHPYEMYWYDKTVGVRWSYRTRVSYDPVSKQYYFPTRDCPTTWSFAVSADYSASKETRTYEMRSDLSSVQTAAANAAQVVADHASEGDYAKLDSYRAEICDRTSYNTEAASSSSMNYGNPWQLIWVFDDDPATTVVCEGYAKAFKHLCDMSKFENPALSCHTASGWMRSGNSTSGGAHMWNIVSLNDFNFLVDVTNCDEGSIGSALVATGSGNGHEPGRGLFMRGHSASALVSDVSAQFGLDTSRYLDGYRVTIPAQRVGNTSLPANNVDYYYEAASSKVLPASALKLASFDYSATAADPDAAASVEALIAGIGTVGMQSGNVIADARSAYEKLDSVSKLAVANYQTLVEAEARLDDLLNAPFFAALYSDGELVLLPTSDADGTRSEAEVKEVWGYLEDASSAAPWAAVADSIKSVSVVDGVTAPKSMSRWFADCPNLKRVNLTGLDTQLTTDMSSLFDSCGSLSMVDAGKIETSQVTRMAGMFAGCKSLPAIDLSSFDMSGIEIPSRSVAGSASHLLGVEGMFAGCEALSELKLGKKVEFAGHYRAGQAVFPALPDGWKWFGPDGIARSPQDLCADYDGASMAGTYALRELRDIAGAVVSGLAPVVFNGSAHEPTPKVEFEGAELSRNVDYTLSYIDNINAGSATVTVTGVNGYSGSKGASFTIEPASITSAKLTGLGDEVYIGTARTPSPKVNVGSATLKENLDYTLSYSNNVNIGQASVTVTGRGNYKDSITAKFDIVAPKPSPDSPSAGGEKDAANDEGTRTEADGKITEGTGSDAGPEADPQLDADPGADSQLDAEGDADSGSSSTSNLNGRSGENSASVAEADSSVNSSQNQAETSNASSAVDNIVGVVAGEIGVAPDGTAYQVIANGEADAATATYQSPRNLEKKSVKVPAKVILNGKTYNVTGIAKGAFKNSKAKTVTIASKLLTKKSVKNCFKGSKVKVVKVPKSKLKAYKKIFTKKNCGAKVKVRAY